MDYKKEFKISNGKFLDLLMQFKQLASIQDELKRITKGKSFRVHNQAAYNMFVGQFRLLVIALTSFLGHAKDKGGLFQKMIDGGLPNFVFAPKSDDERKMSHSDRLHYERKLDILNKEFKCNSGCNTQLCACCFKFLQKEYEKLIKKLDDNRNYFAHIYEKSPVKKNLDISDLNITFTKINGLMGLLSWFGDIEWSYDITPFLSEESIASDVVDQILCGTINMMPFSQPYDVDANCSIVQDTVANRYKFYSTLHKVHDQLPLDVQAKVMFNEKTKNNSIGIFFSPKLMGFKNSVVDWGEFAKEPPYRLIKK